LVFTFIQRDGRELGVAVEGCNISRVVSEPSKCTVLFEQQASPERADDIEAFTMV